MLSNTFSFESIFMKFATFCLTLILLGFCSDLWCQSLPVGTPLLEEGWRRLQIKGERDINTSFLIRPIDNSGLYHEDSGIYSIDTFFASKKSSPTISTPSTYVKQSSPVHLLPLTLRQQYNSHHPYGWNDGSMIQAKGYQSQLSFGAYAQIGPLSIQLQPEVVFAENRGFATFPVYRDRNVVRSYYNTVLNLIDDPEIFGNGKYSKLFAGQSSIKANYKKLSLGVSTENLWWGPGIRNSLLMSNNAPGFPHITFNTSSPIASPIGSFEWQVIGGTLKGSDFLPTDTSFRYDDVKQYQDKTPESRYINGMVATWQPKWTKGLHLGFARVFYLYKSDISSSLDGYVPVIGSIFKNNTKNEDVKSRDQMISAFFRLILPKEKAEVYGELGRNDHSSDSRDFSLEPEHSSAYVIGLRKLFEVGKKADLEFMTEFTSLQIPMTVLLREQNSWYSHNQVRHGYTNRGQVIGAGIGPGGRSQTLAVNWIKGITKLGGSFERVVRNNDFNYTAFTPTANFSSHWVDLSINLNAAWQHKRFIYTANLARVKSLNYHWWQNDDVKNWHVQLSTSYLF